MYRVSGGQFWTIPHVCSYKAVGEHHEVVSNILFLPHDEDVSKYHWPTFSDHPPKKPEIRTLFFTVFGVEGRSLVEAKSPRQLSRVRVHFVLGWLMTYLSGYLQRDVSIRNVLMAERPVRRKAFKVPEGFLAHLSSLEDELLVAKIRALCNRVEQLVAELGIWKDCFSEENQETKSGTPEFMSRELTIAAKLREGYLHSSVDDLEPCFWVALWSVLFNGGHEELSTQERAMRVPV